MKIKTLITLTVSIVVMVVFMPFITNYDVKESQETFTTPQTGAGYYAISTTSDSFKKLDSTGDVVWEKDALSAVYYQVKIVNNGLQVMITDSSGNVKLYNTSDGTDYCSLNTGGQARDALVTDDNLYIYTVNSNDYLSKYNYSDCSLEWSVRNHSDKAKGVAVDSEGYVYTYSQDTTVIKQDSSGTPIWTYSASNGAINDLLIDSNNNIWVHYETNGELRKLDTNKNLLDTISVRPYVSSTNMLLFMQFNIDESKIITLDYYTDEIIEYDLTSGTETILYNSTADSVNSLRLNNDLGYAYIAEFDNGVYSSIKLLNNDDFSEVDTIDTTATMGASSILFEVGANMAEFILTSNMTSDTITSITLNDIELDESEYTLEADVLKLTIPTETGSVLKINYYNDTMSGTALDTMVNLIPLILVSGVVLMTVVYAKRKEA